MPLATEDFEKIGEYIQTHLPDWLSRQGVEAWPPVSHLHFDLQLRERMVRVEEGLRHQGEILERLIEQNNQRFEQIDKRFEEILKQMDKRFEQVNKRFEQVDKRFEQIDKRFEQVDKRFESLTRRIDRFMVWSFALYVSLSAAVLGIAKYMK